MKLSRYTLLYNSNLDKDPSQRKSNNELVEALQKWEKTRSVKRAEIKDLDKYEVAFFFRIYDFFNSYWL